MSLPSRGAWIETSFNWGMVWEACRSPRGGRGLKRYRREGILNAILLQAKLNEHELAGINGNKRAKKEAQLGL
jgi:hypothetical protein